MYILIGILLGLCLFNKAQLDVIFPKVFYRKLLGRYENPNPLDIESNLSQLLEVDPDLVKGLRELHQYGNDDLEEMFGLYFDITTNICGITRTQELIPGGSKIPVTQKNKNQYISALTNYTINASIKPMMDLVCEGFSRVVYVNGPTLTLLSPNELEIILTGTPKLDFDGFRKGTLYEGGYYDTHPTIIFFWEVVSKFNNDQKKEFLKFVSGSPRAPVGGLGGSAISLKIHRAGPDSDQLPTVATCHTLLILPEYPTKEKLENKILLALEFNSRFVLY